MTTGRELLEILRSMDIRNDPDLDLPIALEGCDCVGRWNAKPPIRSVIGGEVLLLTRVGSDEELL